MGGRGGELGWPRFDNGDWCKWKYLQILDLQGLSIQSHYKFNPWESSLSARLQRDLSVNKYRFLQKLMVFCTLLTVFLNSLGRLRCVCRKVFPIEGLPSWRSGGKKKKKKKRHLDALKLFCDNTFCQKCSVNGKCLFSIIAISCRFLWLDIRVVFLYSMHYKNLRKYQTDVEIGIFAIPIATLVVIRDSQANRGNPGPSKSGWLDSLLWVGCWRPKLRSLSAIGHNTSEG